MNAAILLMRLVDIKINTGISKYLHNSACKQVSHLCSISLAIAKSTICTDMQCNVTTNLYDMQ